MMNESTYPRFPVMLVDDEEQALTSFEMTLRSARMNNFMRCQDSRKVMPLLSDQEVEVMLLRATQEALANVRKHARANRVSVTLSYMDDVVVLDVQDNGLGFDPTDHTSPADQIESGYGLTAMRERIEQLGGTLLVESTPGEGTTLVVEILTPAGEQESRLTHKEHRDR